MIPFRLQVERVGCADRMHARDRVVLLCRPGAADAGDAPLRTIKAIVDDVLISLDSEFERLYVGAGHRSLMP